jgi:hypothetical protein
MIMLERAVAERQYWPAKLCHRGQRNISVTRETSEKFQVVKRKQINKDV